MTLLHLISSFGFFGAENLVLNLNISLKNNKIKSTISIFKNVQNPHIELFEYAKKNGIKTYILNCKGKFDINALIKLVKYIKYENIQLVHSHGYKSNFYAYFASKICKIPVISTCHNWIAKDLRTRLYYKIDKLLLPRFNKVVAVSDDIKKELLRIGTPPDKIEVIYNGVDINKFSQVDKTLINEFKLNHKSIIIGTVARFTEEKGLSNLIYAAREVIKYYDNIYFMLVGDGPLMNDLINLARSLNIYNKFIFTGQRNDIPEVYNTFDIFVLPSYKEGLPMVILEAMASKKPIIATSVGAIPDVIEDGKSGLLVPPGDIDKLTQSILTLIKNKTLRQNIGINAYERVKNNFSAEYMCNQYIKVYKEVLQNHNV